MSASDLLDDLDPEQRDAASVVSGPVCILAGAGTGKTRTITHRIAHQIASGTARPDEVLAVTFTDRAAGELRERIARLGVGRVRAATFHAAAWAQLRYFWSRWSDAPLPDVLDQPLRLLAPLGRQAGVFGKDLAAEISWAKALGLDPDGYATADRDGPASPTVVAELYAAYEAQKREQNLIDYDDMLVDTTRLLTERPEVAAQVRERYRFFTVDEVQDVNPAQWALLETWLGDRDELCVVGDDDQSIYGFTGATPAYLTGFTERFPHATVVTLERSYRSTPQVLRAAHAVLTDGQARAKRLRATHPDGPEPVVLPARDEHDELRRLTTRIRQLREQGVPAGEIAVAYRINSQSAPVEEALRDAGIDYTVRGDVGFFSRREIRQAVAAIAHAAARGDEPATPPPAGARPAGPARADRFVERVLRDRMGWHPKRVPDGEAARDRWRNLSALAAHAARRATETRGLSPADLAAELEQRVREGDAAPPPADAEAVTLLTLHKAKGLEFDAVHLLAVEEGLVPISHARDDPDQLAEERRLLYVGCTRARTHLSISWAEQREGPRGKPSRRQPSRFLDALLDGDHTGARSRRRPTRGTGDRAGHPEGNGARGGSARDRRRAPLEGDAAAAALLERLRQWRRERAHDDGVPAFVVCDDAALHEVAARQPTSPDELARIRGFGPTRVARYADEMLAIVRNG